MVMKKLIKKILENKSIIVNRVNKIHLENLDNPLSAIYYNGKFGEHQMFSFNVPIDKCVNIYGYNFSDDKSHHFTSTLLEYKKNPKIEYNNSLLLKFYNNFQPQNLRDVFYLYSPVVDSNLGNNSPMLLNSPQVISLPWLHDILYVDDKQNTVNRSEAGLSYKEGSQSFGPVSEAKAKLEFNRVVSTFNSIKSKGYVVDYFHNQISGYFIKDKNDYRFIIQNGNHRTAALAALGYHEIPVIFRYNYPRVIDIHNIELWPQVRNGNISIKDARIIFEGFFTGKDFSSILTWYCYINESYAWKEVEYER